MMSPTPDDLIAADPPPAFPPWMVAADPRLAAQETNRYFQAYRRWEWYTPWRRRRQQTKTGLGNEKAIDLLACLGIIIFLFGSMAIFIRKAPITGAVVSFSGLVTIFVLGLFWNRIKPRTSAVALGDNGRMPTGLVVLGRPKYHTDHYTSALLFLSITGAKGSELLELWLLDNRRERWFLNGLGYIGLFGFVLMLQVAGRSSDPWGALVAFWPTWLAIAVSSIPFGLYWQKFFLNMDRAQHIVGTWEAYNVTDEASLSSFLPGIRKTGSRLLRIVVVSLLTVPLALLGLRWLIAGELLKVSLLMAALILIAGFVVVPLKAWQIRRRESPQRWKELLHRADLAFESSLGQQLNPDDPDEVRALLIRQGKLGLDDPWPPIATPAPSTTTPPPPPPPG